MGINLWALVVYNKPRRQSQTPPSVEHTRTAIVQIVTTCSELVVLDNHSTNIIRQNLKIVFYSRQGGMNGMNLMEISFRRQPYRPARY